MTQLQQLDPVEQPAGRLDHVALLYRAITAHYRSGSRTQPGPGSCVREIDGKVYVVLAGGDAPLAIYRVRYVKGTEMLKKLKRPPAELSA